MDFTVPIACVFVYLAADGVRLFRLQLVRALPATATRMPYGRLLLLQAHITTRLTLQAAAFIFRTQATSPGMHFRCAV